MAITGGTSQLFLQHRNIAGLWDPGPTRIRARALAQGGCEAVHCHERELAMMTNLKIAMVISMAAAFSTANDSIAALDRSLEPSHQVSQQQLSTLHESEFAILRLQDAQKRLVDTGFVIRQNPLSLLRIKRLIFKPEYDLAILEIDPAVNLEFSSKLRLGRLRSVRP